MKITNRLSLLSFFAFFGIACASAEVSMDFDSDSDGLMDSIEVAYGTDPLSADSDSDSYTDLQEIEQGTDPLDATDHPYLGGWPIDLNCRTSVASTGNDVGDIMERFELGDQFGEIVDSYDFCNHTLLLISGAFW